MSSPREFMDCKDCGKLGAHTRVAGCILATQAAETAMTDGEHALTYQLARDVLTLAVHGHMPDTYWLSDRRVSRAAQVLGLSNEEAREWAEQEIDRYDND
jgi:hypothetical protein